MDRTSALTERDRFMILHKYMQVWMHVAPDWIIIRLINEQLWK